MVHTSLVYLMANVQDYIGIICHLSVVTPVKIKQYQLMSAVSPQKYSIINEDIFRLLEGGNHSYSKIIVLGITQIPDQ